MRKTLIAAALVSSFAALPAIAADEPAAPAASPFTGNFTLATEYIYRGIAQSSRKPAIQGGFDYAHSSGLYVGLWGSNISWLEDTGAARTSSLELDVYGGWKGEIAKDLTLDVGVLTYNYPAKLNPGIANPDTTELYGALTWQWLTAKYSHTTGNLFGWVNPLTNANSHGSGYFDLTGTWDLGDGWGLSAHVGHQKVKNYSDASYTDYKVGVTKDVGVGVVGVNYWTTNAKGNSSGGASNPYYNATADQDWGKGRLLVTFGKTF